jgi:hypothetical protein
MVAANDVSTLKDVTRLLKAQHLFAVHMVVAIDASTIRDAIVSPR